MSIIDRELDYSKNTVTHGSYQLTKIVPNGSTGQTFTVSTSGGEESLFDIPTKVFNPGQSLMNFTITPFAGAGGVFNWLHMGISARSIELFTRSNLFLTNIVNAHRYYDMTVRYNTKMEVGCDMEPARTSTGTSPNTGAITSGYFEGLKPCNNINTNTYRHAGTSLGRSYFEPCYFVQSFSDGAAQPVITYNFRFDLYKDSILGLDKDLYFNENLVLRIVWEAAKFWNHTSTSQTNPATSAATAGGALTISNLALYLAVEQDNDICNRIKEKVANGTFEVLIPYIYSQKQALNNAGTHNISIRYTRAHGSLLKKIYWSAYNATEDSNTAWDRGNVAASKITSFYTLVNSVRTSQFNFACATYDDYMKIKSKIKGSCIGGTDEFYYNWMYIEDFTDNISMARKPAQPVDEQNRVDGLPLDTDVLWDLSAEATATLNHYIFAVTQKTLKVSLAGITLY